MSRKAQQQASQNVEMGQNFANQANQTATSIGGWLQPTLANQYSDPNSAPWVQQAKEEAGTIASGNAADASHKLGLMAERTGNRAGYAAAAGDATRKATQAEALADMGISADASREALSGIEGMYGQNLAAETGNLNAANAGVNAETNAGNNGWFQNTIAAINAFKPGYSSGNYSIGCWVAAELYGGWEDPRTITVRRHIFSTPKLSDFAAAYRKHGRDWAERIRSDFAVREIFQTVFDNFLRLATA